MVENLARNIPHAGPMRWIDSAYALPDGWIISEQRIASDHPFLIQGRLPRSVIIEYIAQTAAAGSSTLHATMATSQCVRGMLIALRDITFYGSASAEDTLNLRVRTTHRMGTMFRCHGQAFCSGTLICEGSFSFVIHRDK